MPGGYKFRVFPRQENGLDWWLTLGPPNLWECRSLTALSLHDPIFSFSLSLFCSLFCFCSGHVPLEGPAVGQTSPSHPPCPQSRSSVMRVAQPSQTPHQEMPNLSKYIHWNYIYCHDRQALNTDLFKAYLLRELFKNIFIYRPKKKKNLTETVILCLQNLTSPGAELPTYNSTASRGSTQKHLKVVVCNIPLKGINLPGTTRTASWREVIASGMVQNE